MESGWRAKVHFRAIHLVPVLAFLSLAAWALASPVGAAPDDDFHLVSIWCANGNPEYCLPGDADNTRIVPEGLLRASCYAFDDEKSASCQIPFLSESATADTLSKRGNFTNAYPDLFYESMGVFAGPNVERSILVMRLVNSALFVALATLLFVLLSTNRRPMLVWMWLITMVPLGLFLIASTNPSGWALTGVGTAWVALLGYFETEGRRRIALGALFLLSVQMAAGSRGDAAFYAVVGIGIVLFLKFAHSKSFYLSAILPLAAIGLALGFFLTSRQIGSGLHGFSASSPSIIEDHPELAGFGLLAYNLLSLPFLWSGVLGSWGLGWLDTGLPDIVVWSGGAAFIAVGFVGLSRMDWRKLVSLACVIGLLVVIPTYVLTAGGDALGANVQPRYLLPLIVILGGLLVLEPHGRRRIIFTRGQLVTIIFALSISNFVSLETNIRRYVTGIDKQGLNLDSGREWWWDMPISANAVWLVGSIAFAATVALLVREVAWKREPVAADDPVEEATISLRKSRTPSPHRSRDR